MSAIRLGILGMSPGNGHPYSWSAIFNGYDKHLMEGCPFPVIPRYLEKQRFPEDCIKDVNVTHIWTQDKELSNHIANSTYIENVVDHYSDMIGKVDGILLARDDARQHYEMSEPFLKAGMPVYIDKPLALSVEEANRILALQQYPGQIFTCSALVFAQEFEYTKELQAKIGNLKCVDAVISKNWEKYSVHIIEPVINIIGAQGACLKFGKLVAGNKYIASVLWASGLQTTFITVDDAIAPITIRLFGDKGFAELVFKDTFAAFKAALQEFIDIMQNKKQPPDITRTLKVVEIIERGLD